MNKIDIILIALTAWFFMRGYNNGFRRELVGLIGIMVGFWVAGNIYLKFSSFIIELMDLDKQAGAIVSYLLTLIGMWFLFAAGALLFMSDISQKAGKIERWFGVVVSVFKFFAVFGAIIYLLDMNPYLKKNMLGKVESSVFYSTFKGVGGSVLNLKVKEELRAIQPVKQQKKRKDIFDNAERVFGNSALEENGSQ